MINVYNILTEVEITVTIISLNKRCKETLEYYLIIINNELNFWFKEIGVSFEFIMRFYKNTNN